MLNLIVLNFVGLSGIMLLTKNKLLSIKSNKNMISKSILVLCIISLYIVINELNSININDYGYLRVVNILNIDFGYDGIGLIFLILTMYLGVISIISNWENIIDKRGTYMILLMLLVILMGLNFVCLDLISFYVLFESTLIPLYLIIGIYGGSKKNKAAYYVLIYTLCSSLFMLLSIVLIYVVYSNVDYVTINSKIISIELQSVLLIGLMIGLGVKTPLVPVHTWLPTVHSESPLGGSILLAGKRIMLALNLAICWEHHLNYKWSISRKLYLIKETLLLKLENIKNNITLDRILRGHTLNKNRNFMSSYLAGYIEGNGTIYVPKEIKGHPSISLSINSKDLPLLMFIQNYIGHGNFYKVKGKNAYTYSIGNIEGMILVINIINGLMRTKKILKLYELIDFINTKYPKLNKLEKLPIDNSELKDNGWFSGFTDSDGCFYVRVTKNTNSSTTKVSCKYELVQAYDKNEYTINIITKISNFLLLKFKIKESKRLYWISTNNYASNEVIIDYFNKYRLLGSKYLDYLDWYTIYNIVKDKKKEEKLDTIKNIKNNMNSKRSYFNWNHLNNMWFNDNR
jgi:hypothetical protein